MSDRTVKHVVIVGAGAAGMVSDLPVLALTINCSYYQLLTCSRYFL